MAGHGSSSGQSWGSPAVIDEVYLANPMEPLDILGMKNSLAESPLRAVEVIKSKRQFNYFRLNEDVGDSLPDQSLPVRPAVPGASDTSPVREEPLLIDLSSDPTPTDSAIKNIPASFPIPRSDLLLSAEPSRLYENCPTATSPLPTITGLEEECDSHPYYSEVPVEPVSPVAVALRSPIKSTSPVSPAHLAPVVTEELKKKRDEAFDWLGQALGEMSLAKPRSSSAGPPYSSASSRLPPPSHQGFEDDFASHKPQNFLHVTDGRRPSCPEGPIASMEQQHRFSYQEDCATAAAAAGSYLDPAHQPHYPKPGSWPEPTAAPSPTAHWEQLIASRIANAAAVQTAHVRPFVVSNAPSGNDISSLAAQVRLSAPWASEHDIKQAILISNSNLVQAVRFLQVEKLYRYAQHVHT